jgi:hypothetical protein
MPKIDDVEPGSIESLIVAYSTAPTVLDERMALRALARRWQAEASHLAMQMRLFAVACEWPEVKP